jgi:MFS family permease
MPPGSTDERWRHGLLLLSTAAGIRAFCIGLTGVLLGLYLARQDFTAGQVGLVIGSGLAGNALATAWLAWVAPGFDRRATLLVCTALSALGLIGVAHVSAPLALAVVAFVGLVNGMGRDRGPAQVIEQSLLSDRLPVSDGARVMARYTASQDVCAGLGSLAAGLPDLLPGDPSETSRLLFAAAGLCSLLPFAIYTWLVPAASGRESIQTQVGTMDPATRRRVRGLTGLFALDSLGGGFLAGSILSYWFFKRFGLSGEVVGPLFLVARGLNALSYFAAAALARRLGLVRTMVFTHLPSSAFLLVLPWAPSAAVAMLLFLAREALVQMDVPARQAFVALVTRPGERVYAFGATGLARNIGWAVGPGLAGWSAQALGLGAPLVIGAGLKMVYDLLLYRSFVRGPAAPGSTRRLEE